MKLQQKICKSVTFISLSARSQYKKAHNLAARRNQMRKKK